MPILYDSEVGTEYRTSKPEETFKSLGSNLFHLYLGKIRPLEVKRLAQDHTSTKLGNGLSHLSTPRSFSLCHAQ